MSELSSKDLAMQALQKIAEHEEECGKRWMEATYELRELRKQTDSHATRWERVAWLLIGTVLTTSGAIVVTLATGLI
jgi:hypothetical protein|tara:strand:- start:490 stop:720 length:231 start_codon:yes stop_codon:yes gene_type:complete